MPEGAHPLDDITCDCHQPKGWKGMSEVQLDGKNWPLDIAAKVIGIPEKDLRELVRITGLPPSGTIRTASFSRQGRNPRAYDGSKLVKLCEGIRKLSLEL